MVSAAAAATAAAAVESSSSSLARKHKTAARRTRRITTTKKLKGDDNNLKQKKAKHFLLRMENRREKGRRGSRNDATGKGEKRNNRTPQGIAREWAGWTAMATPQSNFTVSRLKKNGRRRRRKRKGERNTKPKKQQQRWGEMGDGRKSNVQPHRTTGSAKM